MLKKTMSLLLAICMVMSLLPANLVQAVGTGSASQGLDYEAIYDEKGEVVSYAVSGIGSCTDTDLVIPDTYDGLPVTAIARSAFEQNKQLTGVTMPDSIVEIGAFAFNFCSNLANISLSANLQIIDSYAFQGSDCLEYISIPASVREIGNNPFGFCFNMKEIAVDSQNDTYCVVDGVLYTKDMKTLICYPGDKAGTSFQIPEGVTTIGDSAFEMAYNLHSITIAETVTNIRNGGFHNCQYLESIHIPAGLTGIAENVFENCGSLVSITVDASNPNYCAQDGVLYDKDMTTLLWYPACKPDAIFSVPYGVTTIDGPFRFCNYLTKVIFPYGVTELGSYTVNMSEYVTSVVLPATITYLGEAVFQSEAMTDIYYAGTEEQWNQISKHPQWNLVDWNGTLANFTIHYGVSCDKEHTWVDATCTQPKLCVVCGLTEGDALGHNYVNDVCANCGKAPYSVGLDYRLEGDHYVVTGIGSCTDTDLVIPSTYEGLPVTVIGERAFMDCVNLTSITMPETITKIEHYAFGWCQSVETIHIPENVSYISSYAFSGMWSLNYISVDLNNPHYCADNGVLYNKDMTTLVAYPTSMSYSAFTVPSTVQKIESEAFSYNYYLTEVSLNEGLTEIGAFAFHSCHKLQSIELPSTLRYIGACAFNQCQSLTSMTIPASVIGIDYGVFNYCIGLTEIVVEQGSENFCTVDGVLYSIDKLQLITYPAGKTDSTFAIPEGVDYMYMQAFAGCQHLQTVTFPSNLISVHNSAFQDCDSLTHVVLPESITIIEAWAFEHCDNLSTITIPASVTHLGANILIECRNLTAVIYEGTTLQWEAMEKENEWYVHNWNGDSWAHLLVIRGDCAVNGHSWTDATCTAPKTCSGCGLTEGDALGHNYVNDVCTNCGKAPYSVGLDYRLEGDHYVVTGIGSCTDTELVIPATYNGLPVTVIGSNAFADCTHLTSVTLPDTITTIEEYAFAWCYDLQSINIPYGVTTIGGDAFVWCDELKEITIPATVTFIGDSAFHGCSKLTQIVIPANVSDIGSGAFGYCYDLAQITVDADNAFYCDVDGVLYTKDMTTLVCYPANKSGDSFTVPSSVTTLAYRAFMYADMSEIILPEGLKTIGGSAFESCTNLQSITIPTGVASVGSNIFGGCHNLNQILVEKGNTGYCSVNGVLYSADLNTLVAYPLGNTNTSYTILDGTQFLGDRVFNQSMYLQEVIIPGTVSKIPYALFENCDNLTTVVFRPGVTTIDRYAFNNCHSLSTVSVPLSMSWIRTNAFSNCENLTQILYAGAQEAWNAIEKEVSWDNNTGAYQVVYSALCQNGHEWVVNATCTKPKYCLNCGLTEGDALGHNFVDGTCTVCGRANYSEGLDYMLDGDHYVVTGIGSCTDTELVIPSTYEGLPVTVIGSYAFESQSQLTSITLCEGIVSIGENAFNWCDNVTSVTLPNSLVSIDAGVFQNCRSLTSLHIPAGVTSIGNWIFLNCSNLREITVAAENAYFCSADGVLYNKNMTLLHSYPAAKANTSFVVSDTVEEISPYAFYGCDNLTVITLPEGLTAIGDGAFEACKNLVSVNLPSTVTMIGGMAFADCWSLASITIPASVTRVYDGVFAGCTSLMQILVEKGNSQFCSVDGVLYSADKKVLKAYPGGKSDTVFTIPVGTEVVGMYSFRDCPGLTNIIIPETVKQIEYGAFMNCSNLISLEIPNSVTELSAWVVGRCGNLTSIKIPYTVTSFGYCSFKNCVNLTEVFYGGSPEQWTAINRNNQWGTFADNCVINYYAFCVNGHVWSDATCTAPKTCSGCGLTEGDKQGHNYVDGICTGCGCVDYNGQSVKVYAPYYKLYLTTTTTGKNRLAGGSRENAATWTITVDDNGYLIFSCNGQYLTSGETGNNLFLSSDLSDCSRWEWTREGEYGYLRNVGAYYKDSPQYLQYYGDFTAYGFSEKDPYSHMFELILVQGCEAGGHTYVDGICTECGRSVYSEGLEYKQDGNGYIVTGIGSCTDTDLVIPATYNGLPVTAIANEAFSYCNQLASVILPDSITAIGDYAFGWCYKLQSVHMGNGVRTIGYSAFVTCQKLTGITIPASVTQIGQLAFDNCSSLESIVVDAKNQAYASADGVLFTKDMTQLILYPENKSDLSYTIPYGVTTIWQYAFYDCDMQQLIIPESVTMIERMAIMRCKNMVSFVVSEKSQHYCAIDGVLYTKDMTQLIGYPVGKADSSFVVPDSVRVISSYAFASCNNLQELILQEGLQGIAYGAFEDCNGITVITIPATVTTLGNSLFFGCENLQRIIVAAENENYCSVDGVLYTKDMKTLVRCPSGKEGDLFVIPHSVTQIVGNAFHRCQFMEVRISAGVKQLSVCAFQHCQNLEIVRIPASVTYMEWGAFYGCRNLKQIQYTGTQEQWERIEKEDGWDDSTGEYSITYLNLCEKGHTWVDATCADAKHCTVCGLIEGEKLEHNYNAVVTEPTCTTDGYTTYTCDCGDSYVDNMIPAGHAWETTVSKVPTKETAGKLKATCQRCGEKVSTELPALNAKDYRYNVVSAATSTADGYAIYIWRVQDFGVIYFSEVIRHKVADSDTQIVIDSTTVIVGDAIRLEMVLRNNPGILGLHMNLLYDTDALTLVRVSGCELPMDMDAGLQLLWTADHANSEDGVLCVLEFQVEEDAQPGDYPILMQLLKTSDENFKPVAVHTVSGIVKVINVVYGDVNDDGLVDLIDVLMLRKYLVNIDPDTGIPGMEVGAGADVNGDGEIDLIDVLMLRKYLVNIDPDTGEPGMTLGPQ